MKTYQRSNQSYLILSVPRMQDILYLGTTTKNPKIRNYISMIEISEIGTSVLTKHGQKLYCKYGLID